MCTMQAHRSMVKFRSALKELDSVKIYQCAETGKYWCEFYRLDGSYGDLSNKSLYLLLESLKNYC